MSQFSDLMVELKETESPDTIVRFEIRLGDFEPAERASLAPANAWRVAMVRAEPFHDAGRSGEEALRNLVDAVRKETR